MLYLTSTSNHNQLVELSTLRRLCYILLLHQTTTAHDTGLYHRGCVISYFYIKPQLLYVFAAISFGCVISYFYIKPQLSDIVSSSATCCVISYFYIKPQPLLKAMYEFKVVLYLTSTSNHNKVLGWFKSLYVVLYLTSTSNHNTKFCQLTPIRVVLYLTSTSNHNRPTLKVISAKVVLYLTSTSNHNWKR